MDPVDSNLAGVGRGGGGGRAIANVLAARSRHRSFTFEGTKSDVRRS